MSQSSEATKPLPNIVLVVNDDRETVELYERILSADHVWVTGGSEREAFDYALELRPDAIVSDVDVRDGGTGRAFLQRLRAEPKLHDVPLVVIAGSSPSEVESLGVEALLVKPVLPDALRSNVQLVLDRSRELRTRSATIRQSLAGVVQRAEKAVARSEALRTRHNNEPEAT